jgi:hypothetical protein
MDGGSNQPYHFDRVLLKTIGCQLGQNGHVVMAAGFLGCWHRLGPARSVLIRFPMTDLLAQITTAARAYYAQANHLQLTATDFYSWLDELPLTRRAEVLARGFIASQAEPNFLRACLEWRGYSMRAFMAERLSVAAYELWHHHGEFNGDLPPHAIAR